MAARFSSILLIVYLESEILAECQVGRNESIIYSASSALPSCCPVLLPLPFHNQASPSTCTRCTHACPLTATSRIIKSEFYFPDPLKPYLLDAGLVPLDQKRWATGVTQLNNCCWLCKLENICFL